MTIATIPNRPNGADVRQIELILADFDAILAVVNGNLDQENYAPGTVPQRALSLQATPTAGLTNTAPAIPTNHCQVTLALPVPTVVSLTGRATVAKTAGATQNVTASLFMDNALIPDVLNNRGTFMQAVFGSVDPPTISMLFGTGGAPPAGVQLLAVSGAGDYSALGTGVGYMGESVDLWVPAGTHTFAWAFSCDPSATYTVTNQALLAQT